MLYLIYILLYNLNWFNLFNFILFFSNCVVGFRNDSEKEHDSTCNPLGYTNNCASQNGSGSSPPQNNGIGGILGYMKDPAQKTGLVLRVAKPKVNEIKRIRNEKQVSIDQIFFVKHVPL